MQNRSKAIWQALGWALSAGALVYMVYRLAIYEDYDALATSFRTAHWTQYLYLGMALILLPMQLLVESYKWQRLLQGLTSISVRQSYRQVLLGYVGAFVTPYRCGEYPTRLVAMGYSWEQWRAGLGSWREWLLNWRKWIVIVFWHLIRYGIWMVQLWLVLSFMGIQLPPLQALLIILEYYILITISPSIPSAEVACKGGWAVIVFSQYTDNVPAIAIAVTLIWLINTILPTLAGVIVSAKKK